MAETAGVTYYETLGVEPDATQDDIKKAYRRLLRTAHPDSGGTVGMFRAIQHAYDVLSNPDERARYDGNRNTYQPPPEQENPKPRTGAEESQQDDGTVGQPQPLEPIPTAPHTSLPEPAFNPPLNPPPPRKGAAKWTKVWAIIFAIIGALFILFNLVGAWAETEFRKSVGMESNAYLERIPTFIFIVIFFGFLALLPYFISRVSGSKPPRVPLATDYLMPEHLHVREFGVPGEGLSAGRFGERAKLGKIGEERTAKILRKAALEPFPSARVIHGLRWPGMDHADIDHVLLIGETLMLVDSKYMRNGNYWFDNLDLYRDGQELEPFKLGYSLTAMRGQFPGLQIVGVVLMHSPTGKLNDPSVEMAEMPQSQRENPYYSPILVMNSQQFLQHVHRFASESNRNVVNARLLADLLAMRPMG